jgi:hypothetical protein
MNQIHDIATSVLDRDGSCRDLNFEGATWEGVRGLLEYALGRFAEHEATDAEGRAPADTSAPGLVMSARTSGSIHLVLKDRGSELVRHLQVCVSREVDGSPFVEPASDCNYHPAPHCQSTFPTSYEATQIMCTVQCHPMQASQSRSSTLPGCALASMTLKLTNASSLRSVARPPPNAKVVGRTEAPSNAGDMDIERTL